MAKNVFPKLDIPDRPFHDIMIERIRSRPDRTALVNGHTGRGCSYEELDRNIKRLASGLHRLGLRKSDIVIVFCPNSIEYIVTMFAVMANGAVIAPVNPSYTTYEFEHALKVTQPTWIVTTAELLRTTRDAARSAAAQIKGTIVSGGWRLESASSAAAAAEGGSGLLTSLDVLLSDDGSAYPADVQINSETDVALILFSSGTTGLPKGVMLSHYNIVAMMTILGHALADDSLHSPEEQAVMLVFLPLYHTYGLLGIVMTAIATNQKIILLPRFKPEQVLSCVEKHQVTVLPLVPSTLVYLMSCPQLSQYNISSIRRYNVGAAPLSLDTETEFRRVTGSGEIRQGYGMTETTLACLYSAPAYPKRPGSAGLLLPNTEIKIVDPQTGRVLGANERGEINVRGPQIMMGYINNKEATHEAIDKDGWLHTGDVGYFDDDGYFFVVDRIKELIKYKGFQVAPAELESLLLTHPDVSDAAVVGVPDKEAGELPKAFVVLKSRAQISAEQIKHFIAGKLSSFKQLRGGVEFVAEIPKSETGKILRRILRQKVQVQHLQSKL